MNYGASMADNDAVMDVIFRFKTENQGELDKAKKGARGVGEEADKSAKLGQRAFSQLGRGISTALSVASSGAGSMNQQLAETVRTATQLGQGLIQLTGVTDKQAESMLKAAAASPEFARSLKEVADAAEKAKNPLSDVT